MLPVIAYNLAAEHAAACHRLPQSGGSSRWPDLRVNRERLEDALARNPILVTALNPLIGYEKGAAIAKKAYRGRTADPGCRCRNDRLEAAMNCARCSIPNRSPRAASTVRAS